MNKYLRIVFDRNFRFKVMASRGFYNGISDKQFLDRLFECEFGRKVDWENPSSFNEKLQWLKVYNRKDEYHKMVDKQEVKSIVAKSVSEDITIPTIGCWQRFVDIDFSSLPQQFVLKCTHDSGGLIICRDKGSFDYDSAKEKIERCLKREYYLSNREWPYKGLKPRIIAEPYIVDSKGELNDYKFFCFSGKVRFFKVDYNRYTHHKANYYDTNMELLPFGEADYPPNPAYVVSRPAGLEEMIRIAEKLSGDQPFIRVDLYNVDGKTYFGELTFYPASGLHRLTSEEWDKKIGSYIDLPIMLKCK